MRAWWFQWLEEVQLTRQWPRQAAILTIHGHASLLDTMNDNNSCSRSLVRAVSLSSSWFQLSLDLYQGARHHGATFVQRSVIWHVRMVRAFIVCIKPLFGYTSTFLYDSLSLNQVRACLGEGSVDMLHLIHLCQRSVVEATAGGHGGCAGVIKDLPIDFCGSQKFSESSEHWCLDVHRIWCMLSHSA
jgi:hypothetical protein